MHTKCNTPSPSGYANQVVTKPPAWHTLVVFDILFNNLTTGLFLVSAVGELAAPVVFTPVTTWAYPIALALLLVDLGLLVMDLGDKFRFHHMLRVFKPSSPMSLGTWCLTIYSLFLTVLLAVAFFVAVDWFTGDVGSMWWVRKLAVIGGLPFAFGSAAYKGVLFSTTAQPGWKDARWLGAYLVNSALMLGAGELLIIAVLAGEARAVDELVPAVVILTLLNLVPLGLLANDLHPTLSRLYSLRSRTIAGASIIVAGAVIPAGLLLIGNGLAIASVALIAIVLASLGVRFLIVRLPHVMV